MDTRILFKDYEKSVDIIKRQIIFDTISGTLLKTKRTHT